MHADYDSPTANGVFSFNTLAQLRSAQPASGHRASSTCPVHLQTPGSTSHSPGPRYTPPLTMRTAHTLRRPRLPSIPTYVQRRAVPPSPTRSPSGSAVLQPRVPSPTPSTVSATHPPMTRPPSRGRSLSSPGQQVTLLVSPLSPLAHGTFICSFVPPVNR
ncbi:hypothetical protein NUW54_g11773 [Trametes sanguinea]|uniref:Uncharacterized protein n=1 Tax=Trametes sanguinea TaxID=158606 RepID=A0ACC1N7E5_9APHY|nr:hypothetical protein NUW54_g11773 [Trametes sanguinea]